jgi:hypothetical protein
MRGRQQQESTATERQSDLIKSLFRFLPFEGWQFVEVEFLGRDVDTKVPHSLGTTDIIYIPVRILGGAATIYHQDEKVDSTAEFPPVWTNDYIVLRSSTDNVTVLLLVATMRRQGTRSQL